MPRLMRRVESIIPRRARPFGGKAANLAALARAGFPVPAAYALSGQESAAVLDGFLPADERLPTLLEQRTFEPERLRHIADRVRRMPLPDSMAKEFRWAFEELTRVGARSLVVRSSSTYEDQEASSAAGLHATFLHVVSLEGLLEAAKACWASLFEPSALSYLRGVAHAEDPRMGIVVQAFVPAHVSGVAFTANPLTGDTTEVIVNAAFGLGPSVVDGRVSPDMFRVSKEDGALRDRVIGEKAVRFVPAAGGGIREDPVPPEEQRAVSLDDATLAEVVGLACRSEEQFGQPQDIEWATVGGSVYLLQSRPVSALPVREARTRGRRRDRRGGTLDRSRVVWSNANVGEALPGVATPFTWSVLSGFSELGFRRAFGALGCRVPKDAELVGNFRGRIYLNLTEFSAILSEVPGLRPSTLLALGGGDGADLLETQIEPRGSAAFLMRLPVTVSRFVRENYRLAARVAHFEAYFNEERRRFRSIDLRVLAPAGLGKALHDVEQLLDESGAIMLTCYGGFLASVVALRGVLSVVARDRAEALERGLLTGLADVESAAPGISLWHIAEMARLEPEIAELLVDSDPFKIRIEDIPIGPSRRALEKFLRAYGFRGPREAEIAAPRWREEPGVLLVALRAHLQREGPTASPIDIERRQRSLRDEAAVELERRVPVPARLAVRHLLRVVQRFTRLRERLRSYVTEVLGMFREVLLDANRRLFARDPSYGPDAAFFLTVSEVHAILYGDERSFVALVRRRRRQHERDSALPDPPATFVGHPPDVPHLPTPTDALSGLAASSGVVEGTARVLMHPGQAADLRHGEILIAPYADVGWSPLFTLAGAVVTDLGGPLSHASVVAREYGLPSVVNVKVGTRLIRTGDRVRVDGDQGLVQVLERAAGDDGRFREGPSG